MICEACEGEGWIKANGPPDNRYLAALPCFECNGSGIASCCDAAGSQGPTKAPGYWMWETSGVLRPAVEAYLAGDVELTELQIAALRAYCRQWMEGDYRGGDVTGPDVSELRAEVDGLTSRAAIAAWMRKALLAGIDPL